MTTEEKINEAAYHFGQKKLETGYSHSISAHKESFREGAKFAINNSDIIAEELSKFGLWLSGQGFDKPAGIEYKLEIRGEVYSMEDAVKMYLNQK